VRAPALAQGYCLRVRPLMSMVVVRQRSGGTSPAVGPVPSLAAPVRRRGKEGAAAALDVPASVVRPVEKAAREHTNPSGLRALFPPSPWPSRPPRLQSTVLRRRCQDLYANATPARCLLGGYGATCYGGNLGSSRRHVVPNSRWAYDPKVQRAARCDGDILILSQPHGAASDASRKSPVRLRRKPHWFRCRDREGSRDIRSVNHQKGLLARCPVGLVALAHLSVGRPSWTSLLEYISTFRASSS
jgi:hypothetical protein